MDKHKHNILVIIVLFHGHISSRKNKNPLYHLKTSTKSQQEERKMKRDEMKKEKI
jgi:FtsZ-interacting cell division protein ZipA